MFARLRKDDDPAGGKSTPGGAVGVDEELEEGGEKVKILCQTCRFELTTAASRITALGAHRHVKVNPHGHVYHIACFHPVPGILPTGVPSGEFSWFSGCRWQIALCAGCHVHLGWAFSGDASFTALIEGRFFEESGE